MPVVVQLKTWFVGFLSAPLAGVLAIGGVRCSLFHTAAG